VISIQDTGPGIPRAQQGRVFERFQRLTDGAGHTVEGSGIGLAMVKEIVELHQGQIELESGAGQGTRFIITLPRAGRRGAPDVAAADAGAAVAGAPARADEGEAELRWLLGEIDAIPPAPSATGEGASAGARKERVLLVEDNEEMKRFLTTILGRAYQVLQADDGRRGLEIARREVPEVIVSDVMMPTMDGYELCRRLKSDPRTHNIPLILVSARHGIEAALDGFSAGADDYITKPFSSPELLARVDAQLRIRTLGTALLRADKQVLVCNGFCVPPNYRFIDPHGLLKQLDVDVSAEEVESFDVLIVLDTTAWAQLGPMADVVRETKLRKAVIDHHVSGDDLGALEMKDTTAEATGRLVIEAADALGVELNAEMANNAFVAVATDTGWFRFASTSAETHRLAARLIDAGAQPERLYKFLYEEESLGRLRLTGRTLARAETERSGRLIHTWITRDDFDATGAVPSDSEDLINMTLAVGGTEVAVILVEQIGGGFKVSFRSRCDLDCAGLAQQFGGGGHKKAAGAFIREPLEQARDAVLAAVRAAMDGDGEG